jgi:hypothetical protein
MMDLRMVRALEDKTVANKLDRVLDNLPLKFRRNVAAWWPSRPLQDLVNLTVPHHDVPHPSTFGQSSRIQ